MAKQTDKFANVAAVGVTESAAGTMTFAEMTTGVALGRQTGILIDQLDYYVDTTSLERLLATQDAIEIGWFSSNSMSSFNVADRRQLHQISITQGTIIGTPASGGTIHISPMVYQFFPPMIIAAPRLFLGVLGTSIAQVLTIQSRMYFRYIDLSPQEYIELAEAFVLAG